VHVKGYLIQFVRGFERLVIMPPVPQLLQGGLSFGFTAPSYRAGGSLDGDVTISDKLRVLYGFEAFHEWFNNNTQRSRQGAGQEVTFFGPYNSTSAFACPREADWSGAPMARR
jgi:hypothetical protein